jgi:hypothetical protein
MSASAFAENSFYPQGSALVSGINIRYNNAYIRTTQCLRLTNISNLPIKVKVTVYDHNGNDISYHGVFNTGNYSVASAVPVADGDTIIEIPAHNTRDYNVYSHQQTPTTIYGYATIEWSSSDTQLKRAMIASCESHALEKPQGVLVYAENRVDVNNGNPF